MRTLKTRFQNNIKNIDFFNNLNSNSSKSKGLNLFNKLISKNFTVSNLNLSMKENNMFSNPNQKLGRKLIFYYNKIEYQTSLSADVDISLKEFLTIFANQYNFNNKNSEKKTYQDYQMFKNSRYAPNDFLITRVETNRDELSPLTLVDFDITYENFSARNITTYTNSIDAHSNKLQVYLNSFLDKTKITICNVDHIFSMIKNNPNYYLKNSNGLHQLAASLIGMDNPIGMFKFGVNFDLSNIDRREVKGVSVLRSQLNDLVIPLTVVKESESIFTSNNKVFDSNKKDSNIVANWNSAIVDNLDKIRKLTLKNNLNSNFGIVTDFETWKINYYVKPEGNFIESNLNYQSSLKYHIPLNSLNSSNDTYNNFVKIVKGITHINKKEARALNLNA